MPANPFEPPRESDNDPWKVAGVIICLIVAAVLLIPTALFIFCLAGGG
jgi:hypothetical protein